jgi:hypothetical protein
MKNLANITSGSAEQRATIYFENDWSVQFSKGFLSESETTRLRCSLQKPDSVKTFFQIGRAYDNALFTLHKAAILQLHIEHTTEIYTWVNLMKDSNDMLINTVNDFLEESNEITLTDRRKPIVFGNLNRKDGYFEIDWDEMIVGKFNFATITLPLKRRALDEIIKFKSCINSIKSYIKKSDLDIRGINTLIGEFENIVIASCETFNLDYSIVEIDEEFSEWFCDRFLKG